jgi:hypothetical protein
MRTRTMRALSALALVGWAGMASIARAVQVPVVRGTIAEVRGALTREALTREALERTVGRNLNDVRSCYERALSTQPTLTGRIRVRFVILPTGTVGIAIVEHTDLHDARLNECIAGAIRGWSFPAPEGRRLVIAVASFELWVHKRAD